ncbi:MAG: ATP-binding protein [Lacibacter sp.]
MNLTKKLEKEILLIYNSYWDYYIKGNVEAMHPLLADKYTQVGSAESEVFSNKKEAVQFLYDTIDQVAGKLEMRNRKTTLEQQENSILIHEFCDLYALANNNWVFYSKFRASTFMQQKKDGWKITHQHSSFPDSKTEDGQNIAIDKIAEENLQLREAIKRRTVELEQKNLELEIETSLERVRAEAMGMKKPDDILAICKVMFTELQLLGFSELRNALINFWDDDSSSLIDYDYSNDTGGNKANLSYSSHPVFEQFQKTIKNSEDAFAELVVTKGELESWKQRRRDSGEYEDPRLNNIPALYYYFYSIGVGAIGISTFSSITEEQLNVLKRFRNVFDFAYRRYADVAQAEAQAIEAQIELALERVRARTMAMQHSNELPDAATILFQQVQSLGMPAWSAGYCTWNHDMSVVTLWMSSEGVLQPPFTAPTTEDELFIEMRKGQEDGKTFHVVEMGGEKLVKHYKYMRTLPLMGDILDSIIAAGHPLPTFQIMHHAYFSKGFLLFITYEPVPDAHDIFKRFGKVFDQTYTRFLDLQKAEAQAREAQIEAALERVRSRSMAMHKSDELLEASEILFVEMQKLGIESLTAGYVLMDKEEKNGLNYTPDPSTKKILPLPIIIPHNETIQMRNIVTNWKKGSSYYIVEMDEEETISHQTFIAERSTNFTLNAAQLIAISPARLSLHNFYFKEGYVLIVGGHKLSAEQTDIMLRFTKVFQQTYTRFLDLQKAETQAKEAKIETALERVRSRSLAMHHSSELSAVVDTLLREFTNLEFTLTFCIINLIDEQDRSNTVWAANPETGKDPESYYMKFEDYPFHHAMWNAWKEQKKNFIYTIEGEEKKIYDEYLYSKTEFRRFSKHVQEANKTLKRYVAGFTFFKYSGLQTVSENHISEDELKILERFGRVFEQCYTRFLDLQKAEAQAKEAQIETALEKVRSRTMAMQSSNELQETATVLFNEFKKLGTEDIYQVTIGIYNDEERLIDFRSTSWADDGAQESRSFSLSMEEPTVIKPAVTAWKANKKSLVIDLSGEALEGWLNYRNKISGITKMSKDTGGRRVITAAYYSKGHLSISTPLPVPADTLRTLERFAAVFDSTYTRFLDLEKAEAQALRAEQDLIAIKEAKQKAEEALTELQSTQKQLIQSEKMASLGELTAGIAHEIQNPLNFVNNFSEVSKELLDEMKEAIEKGDTEEAKEIMNDVIQNLEKINHHGKRADGIVKGMLQHSSSGSGKKEPNDINALADEYLRLAYHGLRAKDKSFNATMKTDYDESIGNINIIPQDMGRVILNLLTNAFYVVNEKALSAVATPTAAKYEPTVSVSTRKVGDKVEIKVADNGNGIAPKVLDKIFQPFFTTKPTGQGTGLGLSLSYDIVKAHGGELKVETKEGEGSEFIIKLPLA